MPIPLAAWCKECVCDRSCAGISGSNPTRGMVVSCECFVLYCRGLCVMPIIRPEEFYRVWCLILCEASIMRRPWPTRTFGAKGEKKFRGEYYVYLLSLSCSLPFGGLRIFSENSRSSKTPKFNNLSGRGPSEIIHLFLHTAARNSAFTISAIVEADLQNVDYIKISCQERQH